MPKYNKKRTSLDEILVPLMPSLGQYGSELFSVMMTAEKNEICNIKDSKVIYFYDHDKEPVHIQDPSDFIIHDGEETNNKRGKILLIVKPDFNPKTLTDNLYHSQTEFKNHLKALAETQKINLNIETLGNRSAAKPKNITFIAESIKYSYNVAYRSARLSQQEIQELFTYKSLKLTESIDNATNNRQHKRVDNYQQRLKKLEEQLQKLNQLNNIEIIGRVKSGYGLKLRAKKDKKSKRFGIQNISIIQANDPQQTTIERAKSRNRKNNYGECLLAIDDLKLEIYQQLKK